MFVDRDGTLNEDVGYVDRVERFHLYPYATDALRVLARVGYRLVVVTQQAGVAHGVLDEPTLESIHRYLTSRLADAGVELAGIYYCPHNLAAQLERYRVDCQCRKPLPGMLLRAARELDLDTSRSVIVGDRWRDLRMGSTIGVPGVMVRTGYGDSEARMPQDGVRAAAIVSNLMEAAGWILRHGPLRS